MKISTQQSGELLKSCKGCGTLHDGSFATGQYCSKSCSLQNRNQLARERAYQRAVAHQPFNTLRVDRHGNEYRYIFLCRRCKQEEVWHPVYYFSNPMKYGHLLNYTCRRCSNRHVWDKKRKPHQSTYNVLRSEADRRGIEFQLTFEQFLTFTEKSTCHYCEAGIHWAARRVKSEPKGHNLDRKDNSKGYTTDNCVVCCGECNRIKSNRYSYSEMLRIGSVLKEL